MFGVWDDPSPSRYSLIVILSREYPITFPSRESSRDPVNYRAFHLKIFIIGRINSTIWKTYKKHLSQIGVVDEAKNKEFIEFMRSSVRRSSLPSLHNENHGESEWISYHYTQLTLLNLSSSLASNLDTWRRHQTGPRGEAGICPAACPGCQDTMSSWNLFWNLSCTLPCASQLGYLSYTLYWNMSWPSYALSYTLSCRTPTVCPTCPVPPPTGPGLASLVASWHDYNRQSEQEPVRQKESKMEVGQSRLGERRTLSKRQQVVRNLTGRKRSRSTSLEENSAAASC